LLETAPKPYCLVYTSLSEKQGCTRGALVKHFEDEGGHFERKERFLVPQMADCYNRDRFWTWGREMEMFRESVDCAYWEIFVTRSRLTLNFCLSIPNASGYRHGYTSLFVRFSDAKRGERCVRPERSRPLSKCSERGVFRRQAS
jgi:hypothetical protein